MSILLSLEFEGLPPSVNAMYRTGKGSKRYKKPEVSEWQDEVASLMRSAWANPRPYTGEIEVHILFMVSNKRRWDVDNRLKALLDCLAHGGVIVDDTQISGILALRRQGETSRTKIEVREYKAH
ncbi:MAG: RusA family crossover junction endodeoxyribonuclease [Synergistaceae bacterium]|nr:RusA family crossover junction endodeoxyribonuclease [Synergistaceae bacterium]